MILIQRYPTVMLKVSTFLPLTNENQTVERDEKWNEVVLVQINCESPSTKLSDKKISTQEQTATVKRSEFSFYCVMLYG